MTRRLKFIPYELVPRTSIYFVKLLLATEDLTREVVSCLLVLLPGSRLTKSSRRNYEGLSVYPGDSFKVNIFANVSIFLKLVIESSVGFSSS